MPDFVTLKTFKDIDYALEGGGVLKLRFRRPSFVEAAAIRAAMSAVDAAIAKNTISDAAQAVIRQAMAAAAAASDPDIKEKPEAPSNEDWTAARLELDRSNLATSKAIDRALAGEMFAKYVSLREPVIADEQKVETGKDLFPLADDRLLSFSLNTLSSLSALTVDEGKGSASPSGSDSERPAKPESSDSPAPSTGSEAGPVISIATETPAAP